MTKSELLDICENRVPIPVSYEVVRNPDCDPLSVERYESQGIDSFTPRLFFSEFNSLPGDRTSARERLFKGARKQWSVKTFYSIGKSLFSQTLSAPSIDSDDYFAAILDAVKGMRADEHVHRYRASIKDGRLLAEQVFEGWVKRRLGDGVIVEFRTQHGVFDQCFAPADFDGRSLPAVGEAVRVVSHLLTAPDLESDPAEDGENDVQLRELRPRPGQSGEYRITD